MNAETTAKLAKLIVLGAGIAGYKIDPALAADIVEYGAYAYSLAIAFEAWLKSRKKAVAQP